ncbi:MAG TPA: biopolymer transporter ExbD, partial [Gemmataceae bacterium]|nr:biopolymer transporter ExbD [Gemmataceae bacterium]
LLDLVFQLIMFFMVCVNFVSQQVNEDIKLPIAQSARPMDKTELDVLFLNVDQNGKVVVPGRDQPLATLPQLRVYLRQVYADAKRAAQERGASAGHVKTAVVIRADKRTTYLKIFELLQLCKDVGYQKLQLRALTQAGGS